jgi:Zn-dependent protease
MPEWLFSLLAFAVPLAFAVTLHEIAHGYVAWMLGDPTAHDARRLSLNPLRHVDRFGTLLLPGLLYLIGAPIFGYARPVPVDARNLPSRRAVALVTIAGPATNLLLAFASALALHIEYVVTPESAPLLFAMLYSSVTLNIVLCVFNLVPLLPLDGGRVVQALLPWKLAAAYRKSERYGFFLLFLLMLIPAPPFAGNARPHLIDYIIDIPAQNLRDGVLKAAGIGNEG